MNSMKHQTSKNYELLYDLVMQGNEIPCWVYEHESRRVATVKTLKNTKEIICGCLGVGYFTIFNSENKDSFISECQDYALEWLLPINAEFYNDKGELEYQVALIPFILKRMVTWCPIVLELWRNNIKFYYKGTDKIIAQDYGDYPYFLQNELHWYNYNQETALVEALEILEHIKKKNNE